VESDNHQKKIEGRESAWKAIFQVSKKLILMPMSSSSGGMLNIEYGVSMPSCWKKLIWVCKFSIRVIFTF